MILVIISHQKVNQSLVNIFIIFFKIRKIKIFNNLTEFKIIYKTEQDYVTIVDKIEDLISQKYIIRDRVEYDCKEIITNQEVNLKFLIALIRNPTERNL